MEASTEKNESVMTATDVEKEVSEKLALIKAGLPVEKRASIPMSGYFSNVFPPGIGVVSGTAFDSPAHSPAMYGADCAALRAGMLQLSHAVEKMIDLDELAERKRRDRWRQHQRENPICAGQSRRSRCESRRIGMVSYGFTLSVDGYSPTYRTRYGATMAAKRLMRPGGKVYRID